MLSFSPRSVSLARFRVAKQPLARLAPVAQGVMCVVRHAAVRALLLKSLISHERSIHATSTFLAKPAALLFNDRFAAVTIAAQRAQIDHQIRSAV
jgi:hypothetical protein